MLNVKLLILWNSKHVLSTTQGIFVLFMTNIYYTTARLTFNCRKVNYTYRYYKSINLLLLSLLKNPAYFL